MRSGGATSARRLVRDADSRAAALRHQYEQQIAARAETRDALTAARSKAIYAAVYPDRAAGASPPMPVAGGRHPALERAGIERQVNPGQIWDVLKADAEFVSTALTDEQRQAMGLTKRSNEATWTGTPEGVEAERAEQEKARKRYKALWGSDPSEFGLIS